MAPSEPRDDGRAHVRSWAFAALLASLAMLGPFAIDMYLPAFDSISAEFSASQLAVQQTLSFYLFAYAFMMLWHGALADAFGRRPIVLGGLAIYAIASLGCAIAGNIESLWLFRTLQGISAGAGLVVGRAIVRDRFQGAEAQRLMSQITLVFGVAPALAPVVGGAVLNVFGWRSIFVVMLVSTLALFAWTLRGLPETLAPIHRQPLRARILARNYSAVTLRPEFLLLAAIPTFNFAAFFIYIAGAPAFLGRLGVSTWGFAWLFIPMITGVMTGAAISGRIAGRISAPRTVAAGFACMFAGALVGLLVATWVPPSVPWHVLPITVVTLGSSLMMPTITLLLLDLFPAMRGLASSLQGFVQFAFSGVVAGTIAPLLTTSLPALAAGMLLFTAASYGAWRLYLRRAPHGKGRWHTG
jgi:DHA1 family bicyclomycin/chloramphenicol resistance-like MFS transporter